LTEADALLRAGDLDGARQALVEVVSAKPADQPARMFLFQLLCIAGDWAKARTHLSALAQLSPEAQMLAVAYGQAIDAELFRDQVFAGTATPPNLARGSAWANDLALAIGHFAAGRVQEGEECRDRALDAAPDTPGTLDGVAFDWIADADHRFGPCLEAIVAGSYGIVPFDAVASIKSEGPKDLRDLVWYPVELAFRSTGQSVAAMLPARYPGTPQSAANELKLARATDWSEGPAGSQGTGQRLLSLSGGEDRGLLELRHLSFA
jgi:type VI secretion system protein ImpE